MPQHVPHPLRSPSEASQRQPSSHGPHNAQYDTQHDARHAAPHDAQHPSALPPPPRRIVFLAHRDLDNPSAGGSELLVDRLADGLTRLGHQVTLLCGGPASYRDYRVVSAGGVDAFLVSLEIRGFVQDGSRSYAKGICDVVGK